MIFLDHNSTTPLAPEALSAMLEAYKLPLNSSSTHQLGSLAKKLIEDARNELKKLLNAQNYEVIFTSSSTEATNTVFAGCDARKIIFSKIEHAATYECRPQNKEIIEVEALSNGLIDLQDFAQKLPADGNFLASAMLANNETGAIQPIFEIAKLTHQKGGLLHCDLVQAVGKISIDLEDLNVDFASVSAHKFGGPQGVGALLFRKGLDIKPLILGSKQEKSKRAGTMNVAGIAGFGAACAAASKKISAYESVKKLRDELEEKIKKIGGDDVEIFSQNVSRLPNTSYIATKNRDAQTQVINFDLNKICVSAGPACSSGTISESRILKAMGISTEFSTSAIRVSLGLETSHNEIEKFIETWNNFYKKTQK